jgi:DNA repair exonuclease SbcCD nuclease subunit
MKKAIGVLLTDTHLNKENHLIVRDIFNQAADLTLSLGLNVIYHSGDWFTNRIAQNLETLLLLTDIFEDLSKKGVKIIGIAGNHDKTNQDSSKSYLNIYKDKNFILIKNEEMIIDYDNKVAIGLIPYFTKSYIERLKKLDSIRKKLKSEGFKTILITHIGFNGVKNNDGSEVEDCVPPSLVKFWDLVLVGHYHDASKVGKNIYFVGSSHQSNFGENIVDKGFCILYSDATFEKVMSNFPKYMKIELGLTDNIEDELELLKSQIDLNENKVRIIFKGEREDLHKINQSELKDMGIEIKYEFNDINDEILKAEDGDVIDIDRKSLIKYFSEYCDIQNVTKEKKSKGLKILIKNG